MSDLREWVADVWWMICWTLRQWFWRAYGTPSRLWWRTSRRLFGPGPQSTLSLASTVGIAPGQRLVIEPGTSRRDIVQVVSIEGYTVTVEGKPRIRRKP